MDVGEVANMALCKTNYNNLYFYAFVWLECEIGSTINGIVLGCQT